MKKDTEKLTIPFKKVNKETIVPNPSKKGDAGADAHIMGFKKVVNENGKKEPITTIGEQNIVGVELLIDTPNKIIQFYSITSSVKGYGEKMVSSIVKSAPKEWKIVVVMDWSMGFWQVMAERYPRLIVC